MSITLTSCFTKQSKLLIMTALWNRARHYIFILWFLLLLPSSSIFLFYIAYSQPSHIGYLPYFHTTCGLSANLRCRSERRCTRHAANAGPKNVAKNRHLGTIPQICRAISSQLRHISTIGKKLLSSNRAYLLYVSPQYGELRPTSRPRSVR